MFRVPSIDEPLAKRELIAKAARVLWAGVDLVFQKNPEKMLTATFKNSLLILFP